MKFSGHWDYFVDAILSLVLRRISSFQDTGTKDHGTYVKALLAEAVIVRKHLVFLELNLTARGMVPLANQECYARLRQRRYSEDERRVVARNDVSMPYILSAFIRPKAWVSRFR